MLVKNIITAFAFAGLATATLVEDIEERAQCSGGTANSWCCASAVSPLNIFFIRGVGSNCRNNANDDVCSGAQASPLCCATNQIVSGSGNSRNVVCTV